MIVMATKTRLLMSFRTSSSVPLKDWRGKAFEMVEQIRAARGNDAACGRIPLQINGIFVDSEYSAGQFPGPSFPSLLRSEILRACSSTRPSILAVLSPKL